MADIFNGLPVFISDTLDPGTSAAGNLPGRGPIIFMHPTVAYGFELVGLQPAFRASDPTVMVLASTRWQQDVIAQAAERAVERLDRMVRGYELRDSQRAMDTLMRERLRVLALEGHAHDWDYNMLSLTSVCDGCGLGITDEMWYRLGLNPEWRYGTASVTITADTSAFQEALR